MSMLIRQHVIDNVVFLVVFLRIEGAMIIDDDRDFLKQQVTELLGGRQVKIVLDLENCLWISELCVKAFCWCRDQAQKKAATADWSTWTAPPVWYSCWNASTQTSVASATTTMRRKATTKDNR